MLQVTLLVSQMASHDVRVLILDEPALRLVVMPIFGARIVDIAVKTFD